MSRTSYSSWPCPIARTVDAVGDPWSLLILRDSLLFGTRKFSDFQRGLDIPSSVLTQRLNQLVGIGVLARQQSTKASRPEYHPTAKGGELWPLLMTLLSWGNRWEIEEDLEFVLIHRACGSVVQAERCSRCDRRLCLDEVELSRRVYLDVALLRIERCSRSCFADPEDRQQTRRLLHYLGQLGIRDRQGIVRRLQERGAGRGTLDRFAEIFDAVA